MAPSTPGSPAGPRFLQLAEVAEILNTSSAQVYALVRSGELPAIKIGGRGQWRVETSELENYIQRMYQQTREFVSSHRFGRVEGVPDEPSVGGSADESGGTD
jgi:excisionase family DNA binding protein